MALEEQDLGILTEEEEQALKNPQANDDEPETTSDEPKVEKEEPSPPEPGEKVEPKPGEEPAPAKKPEPKPAVEPLTPSIDGILTKDGKNVIPFNVLEQERAKRQQLEAELAEFKKPKAEVKATAEPQPEVKPQQAFDVKAILQGMGIDVKNLAAKAYESQDNMAEVLEIMLATGIQIAHQTAQAEGKQGANEIIYETKINQLRAANNTWLTPELEKIATVFAQDEMMANPPKSVDDFVAAAEKSLTKVKELFKVGQPAFDPEAERKKIREEETKNIMAKFNIKPAKVTTLSGVRNVNPESQNKFDALDQLGGIDFEDGLGKLTPEERDAYLRRDA